MTPKTRADYIAKLVLYVNASISVCCWGSLPTGADYYDTYNSLDLIDAFGKEMIDVILEAQYGWIREDHLGQTHAEYMKEINVPMDMEKSND